MLRDAVVFDPNGLHVRHKGEVQPLQPGKFFENSMLPIEIEGCPLLMDFFRSIDVLKKHEVKTLGQIARMNIFDFLSEIQKETSQPVPEELVCIEVRKVVGPTGFDGEVGCLGKEHETGNRYSIEFYPLDAISELPIILNTSVDLGGGHNIRHDFTLLEFYTTLLWFIGWYSSPEERDNEHERLLAEAKERQGEEPDKVTIQ